SAARAHGGGRARWGDDATVLRHVDRGVAGPARFVALLAARARHARLDHRVRGAIRSRPAVHLRRLPQPAAPRDAARGRPDRGLRLRAPAEAVVGEEARGKIILYHVSPRRATT